MAIYYVSNTGNDSANGLSQATAWKSIAKVNSTAFSPNDSILLQNGGSWSETWTPCCDGLTLSSYGASLQKPVLGTGQFYGVFALDRNSITVSNIQVSGTTYSGMLFAATTDNSSGILTNINGSVLNCVISNWGSSFDSTYFGVGAIYVRGAVLPNQTPLSGWTVSGNQIGQTSLPATLNYNVAGIQINCLKASFISGNTISTKNAMGIQSRSFFSNTSGSGNIIANNVLTNCEGNITAVCFLDSVLNNTIQTSRGFGVQVGTGGVIQGNIISNLMISSDGTLYNGIDTNGQTNVTISGNVVSNVSAAAVTLEDCTNSQVLSNTFSNDLLVYVTATSVPTTLWSQNTFTPTNPSDLTPFHYGGQLLSLLGFLSALASLQKGILMSVPSYTTGIGVASQLTVDATKLSLSLAGTKTHQIVPTLKDGTKTMKVAASAYTYISRSPGFVTVSSTGLVTGLKLGSAVIEVCYPVFDNVHGNHTDGSPREKIYAEINVTVNL